MHTPDTISVCLPQCLLKIEDDGFSKLPSADDASLTEPKGLVHRDDELSEMLDQE